MAVAAGLALAFTAACVACLVYLHLAPTGYSPVRNAVSEYGRVGPYARWYRLQASSLGLAAICLAVAFRHHGGVAALLCLLAAARIAIGWFPTDAVGARERTRNGAVHLLLAVVAFTAASWAAILLNRASGGEPALGRVMAVFAVATMVSLRTGLRPWFGLIERGYYVATIAWLVLVSVRLL